MATNEELQAQIDALREALGALPQVRIAERDESAARLVGGPQYRLRYSTGDPAKQALEKFDRLRAESNG